MYERFYGLRERPFDLVPNPRYLFLTARQREALSNLRYGLTTPRGLTLLIGEAGTGKTTLVHAALTGLEQEQVKCVLLSNPTLTRGEFFEFLTQGFGLGSDAATSKTQFLFHLRRCLLERHEAGQTSAIVLDEAQSLPYELLEEVRLLGNIETDSAKLLNVVLAGQPELAGRLNESSLRQLKQRVGLRCELAAFDFNETAAYIAGRLRIAGGDPAAILTREAVLAIHAAAAGVPRTINVVCDNALMGGFAGQIRPVTKHIVEEVCRDFDLTNGGVAAPVTPAPVASSHAAAAPASGTAPSSPRFFDDAPLVPPAASRMTREPSVASEGSAANQSVFEDAPRKRRFSFF